MFTLGAGRIFIKSIIIVCLLNLMACKASWAHRTGENEKKIMIKSKSRSKRRAPVVGHKLICMYDLSSSFWTSYILVNYCKD